MGTNRNRYRRPLSKVQYRPSRLVGIKRTIWSTSQDCIDDSRYNGIHCNVSSHTIQHEISKTSMGSSNGSCAYIKNTRSKGYLCDRRSKNDIRDPMDSTGSRWPVQRDHTACSRLPYKTWRYIRLHNQLARNTVLLSQSSTTSQPGYYRRVHARLYPRSRRILYRLHSQHEKTS